MQKKFLALLLTFCMVLTLVPISVFANSEEGGTLSFGDAVDLAVEGWTDATVQTYRPMLMRGEILALSNVKLYDASSAEEGLSTLDATTSFDVKVKIRASDLDDGYTAVDADAIKTATGLNFRVGVNQNGGWPLKTTLTDAEGTEHNVEIRYNVVNTASNVTWDGTFQEITYTVSYADMDAKAASYIKEYNAETGNYDKDVSDIFPLADYSVADAFIAAKTGVLAVGTSGVRYQYPSQYAPMDVAGIEVVKHYTVGEENKDYTLLAWGDYSEDNWDKSVSHTTDLMADIAYEYTNTTGTTSYAIDKTLAAGVYRLSGDFAAHGGELILDATLGGFKADDDVAVTLEGTSGDIFFNVTEDTYVDALTLTWSGDGALVLADAALANVGVNATITAEGESIAFDAFPGATAVDANDGNDMLWVSPATNYAMGFYAADLCELEANKEYTVSFDFYSPIATHNRRLQLHVGGVCLSPTYRTDLVKWVDGYNSINLVSGERYEYTFTTESTYDPTTGAEVEAYGLSGALTMLLIGNGANRDYTYAPYAIDNLTIVDNATGSVVNAYDFEYGVPENFTKKSVLGDSIIVDGVEVWPDSLVNASTLSTITECDYLAVANGDSAKLEGSTISLVAGKYTVTGNFRAGEYTSANLAMQNYDSATKLNVTADYNGASVDLVVTYSDGTSITVAPEERVDGELDTEYMNWTALTYQFGNMEDKTVTAIEFISSGYNAQSAAESVAFDMRNVELTCEATFDDYDGSTLDLDAIAEGATDKTVAANEYLHFDQRRVNNDFITFVNLKDYMESGATYSISMDIRSNDGRDTTIRWNMRAKLNGTSATNEGYKSFTAENGVWTNTSNEVVSTVSASNTNAGTIFFLGGTSEYQIDSVDIDNLVVKVVTPAEGSTTYTADQIILSTNEADKGQPYYKSWSEVATSGTVLSEATDYMTSDENTISYAMNTKLDAGAYKLTGSFRMSEPALEKVLCYYTTTDNKTPINTVQSRDGAGAGNYNGVNLVAKVTYIDADGLKTVTVPASAAVSTNVTASGTVTLNALAYAWTDVEFDFMLDNDVVITDVEIVSTGYDVVVDNTIVRMHGSYFPVLIGVNAAADSYSTTAVAEPFDAYSVKFEAVSDGIVLENVGDNAALDETAGEWTGMTEITPDANDYLHFERQDRYNDKTNGFYTGLTFEVGQSYELSMKIRSFDNESHNHYFALQGAGANGAELRTAKYDLASKGKWTTYTYDFTPAAEGTGFIYYYGMNQSNFTALDLDDIVITKYTLAEDGTTKIYGDVVFSTLAADAEADYYVDLTNLDLDGKGTHASEVASYMTSADVIQNNSTDNKLAYNFADGAYIAAGSYKLTGMFRNSVASRFRVLTETTPTSWNTFVDLNGVDLVANVTLSNGTVIEVPAKFANKYTKDAGNLMFTPVDFVFEVDEMVKIVSVEFVGLGTTITVDGEIVTYGKGNQPATFDPTVYKLDDVTFTDVEEPFYAYGIALECITEDEANEEYVCEKHAGAPVVVENEYAGNCQTVGSYDNVSYCQICGEEVSRTTVTTEVLGDHVNANGTCTLCGKIDASTEYTLDEEGESVVMTENHLDGVTLVEGTDNNYLAITNLLNGSAGIESAKIVEVKGGVTYNMSFKVVYGGGQARVRHFVYDGTTKVMDSQYKTFDLAPGAVYSYEFTPDADGLYYFRFIGNGVNKFLTDCAIDDLVISVVAVPEVEAPETEAIDEEATEGEETEPVEPALQVGDIVFEDRFDTLVANRYKKQASTGVAGQYINLEIVNDADRFAVAEGESAVFDYNVNLVYGAYELALKVRDVASEIAEYVSYTKADADAAAEANPEAPAVIPKLEFYVDAVTYSQIKENYNGVTVKAIVTYSDGTTATFLPEAPAYAVAWTEYTYEITVAENATITNIEFVASGYKVVDGVITAIDKAAFEMADVALTYIGEPACIHEAAEAVVENEVDATCTTLGSYDEVVYCALCGEEMSRTTVTGEVYGDHVAADAVRENEVEATCTATGYYEEVIYCSLCGEEMSRTPVVTEKAEHNFVDGACTECLTPDPDAPVYEVIEGFEVTNETRESAVVTAPTTGWIIGENTFNVACDTACRVFVTNDGGVTYTKLIATANAEGGYDFTTELTADSEIIVMLYGDINGNGRLAENDYTAALEAYLDSDIAADMDALALAILDNNGDGKITVNEVTLVRRALLGYDIAW